MAPVRPEFFYHPVVGVVSPTSLGLLAFKSGPLAYSPQNPPKPLTRVTPPELHPEPTPDTETVMLSSASPLALDPPVLEAEPDMKKPRRDEARNETCIVTREEVPHTRMIRFVVDPDNNVVPDFAEKLPGSGFWVTAQRDILKKAIWRNSFTTAARTPVNVSKDIIEQVEIGLLRQALETLAMTRKAGLLTQGFAKVEEVLQQKPESVYVVASDAKENGREKLEKLVSGPLLDIWTSSQLSAALGEDNAVHIVLTPGGLTDKLLIIAQKLKDIR